MNHCSGQMGIQATLRTVAYVCLYFTSVASVKYAALLLQRVQILCPFLCLVFLIDLLTLTILTLQPAGI